MSSRIVDASVWQRQAARTLVKLLDAAAERGLAGVDWQVGELGILVGRFHNADMRLRRAGFLAWTQFLGISDWRTSERHGVTHLYGRADQAGGPDWRRCQIALMADLYDNSDGGEPS